MNDHRDIDGIVTSWLRATAVSGGASERVLDRALDQVAALGQEHGLATWWRTGRRTQRLTAIAIVVSLLLVASTVAVFVGSQARQQIVPPPALIAPIPSVVAEAPPSAPAVSLPAAAIVGSGSAESSIGQIEWTKQSGDVNNLPSGQIFAVPGGLAAIEVALDGRSSRLWSSTDGRRWSAGALPVPTRGRAGHAFSGDLHWIWSMSDLRLWRSADFKTWTEVDIAALAPTVIPGVAWTTSFGIPASAGGATVLPWSVYGSLDLAGLLGVPVPAGQGLTIYGGREHPAVGDVRPVYRERETVNGPERLDEVVGHIRIDVAGSVVTVTDVDRGVAVADVDATVVGMPVAALADAINQEGAFSGGTGGAVVTGERVDPLMLPPDVWTVVALDGRFVTTWDSTTADEDRRVWASMDGIAWEPLGAPILPDPVSYLWVTPRPVDQPDLPLTAFVTIDEAGTQRAELWTSMDGRTWVSTSVLPNGLFDANVLPSGYLATTDERRIQVSPDGVEWTVVGGIDGVLGLLDTFGGTSTVSFVDDTLFIAELPLADERVMWVIAIKPTE